MSHSLWLHGLLPTRLLCPWNFSGKNTEVGCHFLLQGVFLTQGSNSCLLCLLHCRQMFYPLSHQGSPLKDMSIILGTMPACMPTHFSLVQLCNLIDHSLPGSSVHRIPKARILEWIAVPSSNGSSWPKDQTSISYIPCTAGWFFTADPQGKTKKDITK